MADSINTGGTEAESPKKKGFNLNIGLKYVAEVDTPIGKLYLFPLRISDLLAFSKLSATDSVERIRKFLPCIASLYPDYGFKQKRVGITVDQASNISDQMLQNIAQVYALSNGLRSAREGEKGRSPITRTTNESATKFLDRLLRSEVEEHANQVKKILGPTHDIFDQVRKSSLKLGETWKQFEKLSLASSIPMSISRAAENRSFDTLNHISEQQNKLARERAEDRELVRLTGQMSAQSAKTLQQLASAASTMLEKLDERDVQAKHTTKIQLWIAVVSVIISAVLALIALIFSGAAFYQDKANISSGDKWQDKVLEELEAANTHSARLEFETHTLRQKVEHMNSDVNKPRNKSVSSKSEPSNQELKIEATPKNQN